MVNKNDFELYLINNKGEKKSLMYHEFDLNIDNLKSKTDIEYEEYKTYQYILNYKNNVLNDETIQYSGACSTSKRKKAFEDYLLKQKQGFKLYYKNNILKEEYYCFVDLKSLESKDVDKYDEYEIEIELKRVSNWIKEIPITFFDDSEQEESLWNYGDKRPVIYTRSKSIWTGLSVIIKNDGHEPAPFILEFGKGASGVKWYLKNEFGMITDELGKNYEGELDITISEKFFIDTYNNMIYSNLNDYSYLREKRLKNFFDVPIGECTLFIRGATEAVRGTLYEQYDKI